MSVALERLGRRFLATGLALLCIATPLFLASPSSSSAAGPTLTITSPKENATIKEPSPTIKGESSAPALPPLPITVSIYELPNVETPVEQITTEQKFGTPTWSVTSKKELPNGLYKAVAEQTEQPEPPSRAEVTFSVNTAPPPPPPPPPTVTMPYPVSGTTSPGESQLFSGSASTGSPNQPDVTIEVFRGTTPTPPALSKLAVPVASNGYWNGTVQPLAPGTYTAVAAQQGNGEGRSAPVTFTLTAPVSGPATPPTASFTWFPAAPVVGQNVVLVSTSSDLTSPIASFAWDLLGNGPLNVSGPVLNTVFAGAGDRTVRLQVADGRGASATATKIIPVSSQPLRLMQPFPIVRIAGVKTSYGVRLSALNVQLPVGARVNVTCKGRACKKLKPVSRVATASANNHHAGSVLLAFRGFERAYHAGATLEVRIFASGEIGKFTSFMIHRHGLPTREDQCLSALDPHPIPCPG
ncbi:MAG TPA: PKD domain-containing protein [Solirubrobacteraceae bacterium]|jgi:hypothetical protein|nr:PKD domain-containing protein [Solirubrobacteraceae bacterium]